MGKYKVCVYAICKNEEQFVDRWMESMSEADQVVVLDTGSDDGTVERLQARGAAVTVETVAPWRFDAARNRPQKVMDRDGDTTEFWERDGLLFDPDISKAAAGLVSVVGGEVRVKQATRAGYIVAEEGDGINLAFPTSKTRRGRVVKGKSNTLACDCEGCVYHDGVIRKYTMTELERLQTLPDGYTARGAATRAERVKAIGNGWTAAVIAEIFSKIR